MNGTALLETTSDAEMAADEIAEDPAEARVRREREAVAELERDRPLGLRRRLLDSLADAPSMPTELARGLHVSKESVSRKLRELRGAGLVEARKDLGDGRRLLYSLTAQGEAELSRHRAFGAVETPPSLPSDDEARQFLWSALGEAVAMRRQANRLEDAVDRFEAISVEARKIDADDIALEALAERATTLRQERQTTRVQQILRQLDQISLGVADVGPELVLPAAAHLEYARGRMGDLGREDIRGRAQHLTAAISLYGQLAQKAETPRAKAWSERRAWSVISLAGNLRKQSEFEAALKYAAVSMKLFAELDEPYGRSHCLFMFGFCLRLLGDFDKAWTCLDEAYGIADAHSFQRIRADALMQMGEVRRCQGQIEEARILLNDALDQADSLALLVTQAFAQSALGAVAYQDERFPEAESFLSVAQDLFEHCRHVEGVALNARRQATVARRLSDEGTGPGIRVAGNLLRRARSRYARLHRPAGIVACEVEQGRLRMSGDQRRVGEVVAKLRTLLENRHQRAIVELDPWVPRVLDDFARDLGDDGLAADAGRVLDSAKARLADKAAEGVKSVSAAIGRISSEKDGRGGGTAAEMGGETRRDASDLALPFAV
jgi:DNA-binding MarR family transcriptional regulator